MKEDNRLLCRIEYLSIDQLIYLIDNLFLPFLFHLDKFLSDDQVMLETIPIAFRYSVNLRVFDNLRIESRATLWYFELLRLKLFSDNQTFSSAYISCGYITFNNSISHQFLLRLFSLSKLLATLRSTPFFIPFRSDDLYEEIVKQLNINLPY